MFGFFPLNICKGGNKVSTTTIQIARRETSAFSKALSKVDRRLKKSVSV